MAEKMEQISLNGVELGYCTLGAGPNKPPLVFVHGAFLRSTAGPYEELLQLLAQHYTVHALDLRGCGASARAVEGWTFEAVANDIVAFSRALGLHRPVYVGHSLGAFIGLFAEIRHPGAFSALCLLCPGPANPKRNPPAALQFLIEHGHDREMLRGAFGRMFVRPPGQLADLMLDAITLVDKRLFRALLEQESQTSIEDQLKEISAPVLLICGERDKAIPPAVQHDIARKVQRCKEVVFSTEGHMLPNESAPMVAREILTFLDHDRGPMAIAPRPDDESPAAHRH